VRQISSGKELAPIEVSLDEEQSHSTYLFCEFDALRNVLVKVAQNCITASQLGVELIAVNESLLT
jgi:hypothetical protein